MPENMRAQVFYEPYKMQLEEVPLPSIGDDEVLVRVQACGVCGSDIAYYYGDSPLETEDGKGPLILGHEFTADVVAVGSVPARGKLFSEGDRVVVNPVQYCNACDVCLRGYTNLCENKTVLGVSVNGGFAEYCKSKYTGVVKLPDNVSYEQGAVTEPLACATYAIQNLQVKPGDFVVIFGPGPIGLMILQLCKSSGAGKVCVVGTRDYRLQLALQLGADIVLNPKQEESPYYCPNLKERIADLTKGKFADRAITSTGSAEAMEQALQVTGRRSVIVFFGLPGADTIVSVPALQSILWDKTIRFSWLAPSTWPTALQALATGLVDVSRIITHSFPLDRLADAIANVKERKEDIMKAVVKS